VAYDRTLFDQAIEMAHDRGMSTAGAKSHVRRRNFRLPGVPQLAESLPDISRRKSSDYRRFHEYLPEQ